MQEVGGDPLDTLRVPAGRDDEEDQGGVRALLPEDLPPVVGTPGPGEGGGQVRAGPAAGACVAGGRAGHQVGSLGNASHTTVYAGVGADGRLVRTFHEYRDFAQLQVLVRQM